MSPSLRQTCSSLRPDTMRTYLALLVALAVAPLPAQSAPIVIRAGHVIDGRGGYTMSTTITGAGDKTASARTIPPAVAATYDLTRYTVLPGLIDIHEHVGWHFNKAGRFHTNSDG